VNETEFNQVADGVLNHLADVIDDVLGDRIDVELHAGILTMDLENGGQYVINKHGPNKEIWLSSPVSGAAHFKQIDGVWTSTRDSERELMGVLSKELGLNL